MIAWQEVGSFIYSSLYDIDLNEDWPFAGPPAVIFNGSMFLKIDWYGYERVVPLGFGSLSAEAGISGAWHLTSFWLGSTEFVVCGTNGGLLVRNTGNQTWFSDFPSGIVGAATVATTPYGAVIGVVSHGDYASASLFGFDGQNIRPLAQFSMSLQSGSSVRLSFAVFSTGGKYVYATAVQGTSLKGFMVDTETWQTVSIDSAFDLLESFCRIASVNGSCRSLFSVGHSVPFCETAFVAVPRAEVGVDTAAVCAFTPRADNLFYQKGIEFSLPLDYHYTTPTPFGIFLTSKSAVLFADPVSGVSSIVSANQLGVRRFVSNLDFRDGSFWLVGYKGKQGDYNHIFSVFLGTLTIHYAASWETDLLYPRNGSVIGFAEFRWRPMASSTPAEFEVVVTDTSRHLVFTFASYAQRSMFEYSLDGTHWVRMTGPMITDGTLLMRAVPETPLPPGTYEWRVRRIEIGG